MSDTLLTCTCNLNTKNMILKIVPLILFIQFSLICFGQDGVVFKMSFKPETEYQQIMSSTTESIIKYSGSEDFLAKMKEKGVDNPNIVKQKITTELSILTGKLKKDGRFPIVMEYVNTDIGNDEKLVPDGTKIYGSTILDSMPILDSISSIGLTEEFKNTLLKTMQSTFSQIEFPNKNLKIGETFEQKTPLSIPVADVSIEMVINSTYKLVSISNGIATFDIIQEYVVTSTITKYQFKIEGNGKGVINYDIDKNYFTVYKTEMLMKMNVDLDSFSMDLEQKSIVIQNTIISKI